MKEKNELFDIINAIFTDKNKINEYSDLTLNRNSFMVNRLLSINFPLQANALNIKNINSCDLIKSWNIFLPEQIKIPNFLYTKGSKKVQENKNKNLSMPNKNEIVDYCLTYNENYKNIMSAMKFFKEDMIAEINDFIKIKEQLK